MTSRYSAGTPRCWARLRATASLTSGSAANSVTLAVPRSSSMLPRMTAAGSAVLVVVVLVVVVVFVVLVTVLVAELVVVVTVVLDVVVAEVVVAEVVVTVVVVK
mmetsp:Transcript_149718/g.363712  ORF Transcript_149718/g.363712 Transcript_149718/m.363712 type:complete len:104 (+) Transcript_149718:698-1009(+)